jgi:DNA-binding response OmpR family regulator
MYILKSRYIIEKFEYSYRARSDRMKRILVVEDDIMLNSDLCYNLELDKYRAVPAHNVTETLEKMKGKVYDLVVLDVNLPDGSGFNLCKKIRTVQDVPIVFLTARDLEEDVMTGFELVADDYITKPFNINIFRKKVLAILRRSEKKKDRKDFSIRQGL